MMTFQAISKKSNILKRGIMLQYIRITVICPPRTEQCLGIASRDPKQLSVINLQLAAQL